MTIRQLLSRLEGLAEIEDPPVNILLTTPSGVEVLPILSVSVTSSPVGATISISVNGRYGSE